MEPLLPPLTPDQQALAMSCFSMARALSRVYAFRNRLDRDECESLAMHVLTRAAAKYDPSRGVPFGAFAHASIERSLWQRHIIGRFSLVKRPLSSPVSVIHCGGDNLVSRSAERPIDAAARRETAANLSDATSTALTRNQFDDMRRYYGGETQTSIACRRGVSKQSVSTVVSNGVRRLRKFAVPVDPKETAS